MLSTTFNNITDPGDSMIKVVGLPSNSRPGLYITNKGTLDSQPQVIKLTSCMPMVGGSPASSTTKTGRHDIAEIFLKVALNTIIQISNITLYQFD